MSKRLFVTVGSTTFSELITAVLASETLRALDALGYRKIVIQYGADKGLYDEGRKQLSTNISVTGFDYSPSIQEEMKQADLIISHAGSGSILEALHLGKPLIAIPNSSLMDNHQIEVAEALARIGYIITTTPSELAKTLNEKGAALKELKPFPKSGASRFAQLLDEDLGVN